MTSFYSSRSLSPYHFFVTLLFILTQVFVFSPAQASPAPEPVERRPLFMPVAGVALGVPSEVFIGQEFTFTASFSNNANTSDADPADTGYGPFIDLVFPVTGVDGDDGIDFVSASYGGAALLGSQVYENIFPDDDGIGLGTTGCVQHPIAVLGANVPPVPSDVTQPRYMTVCGTAGDKLVTLVLPFGSFVPGQPTAEVTVTAQLSDLADVSTPLNIQAAGGFQYGATPTNDFCCSPFDATLYNVPNPGDTTTWPGSSVEPIIMTLAKTYVGPENETATGPNFPRQYRISVDIADGQTVSNLNFVDILPDNIQFIGIDSVTGGSYAVNGSLPSTSTPGGTLDITLDNPVTGTSGSSDAILLFSFYVDRLDASSNPVIDASTGEQINPTNNSSSASGPWDPIDPRDDTLPLPTASGACAPPCVGIQDESIAVQKSVRNITDGSNSPGDVLEYTLEFQVSDFFGFEDVVLTDVISDGQRFDTGFAPTLDFSANPASNDFSGNFVLNTNYTVDSTDIGNTGPGWPASDGTDGTQTITFNVSGLLGEQLLGGCVNPTAANNPPVCTGSGPYGNDSTVGTIRFQTIIQDEFSDEYPSGDESVDHGDTLDNNVDITGTVLDLTDYSPVTGFDTAAGTPVDDSGAGVTIAFGGLVKSIYAVNGSTTIPEYLTPGDEVTYSLTYTQPASDFEETVFTDYLPLPVYDASEITVLSNAACGGTYPAGTICLGSGDTFHTTFASVWGTTYIPTLSVSPAGNSFTVTYPEFDDLSNRNTIIELMVTVTVQNDPFADGLFLTNQAAALEGTTNAGDQNVDSIIQIRLGEPDLSTSKTAVSTSHTPVADVTFASDDPLVPASNLIVGQFASPANAGVPFTTPLGSDDLSTDPDDLTLAFNRFNSTMFGVDDQDLVKYAILIENRGHSANGGYDIVVSDIMPPQMDFPGGASANLNLQLYRGDGEPLTFAVIYFGGDGEYGGGDDIVTPGDSTNAHLIFTSGYAIRVNDPTSGIDAGKGACQVHEATSGRNVIVITYDLQVDGDYDPNTIIENTTTFHNYGGTEGGPNHLPKPEDEDANIVVGTPSFAQGEGKTLLSTELDSVLTPATVTGNTRTQAVIGELATYELEVNLHEGRLPAAQLVDTLDAGLSFVRIDSVTVSPGVTVQTTPGTGTIPTNVTIASANGGVANQLTYNFGDIVNANTDDAVNETITIVYTAVVNNVGTNQSGTGLNNSAQLTWGGGGSLPAITSEEVIVLEPVMTINKDTVPSTITSLDAGDTLDYRIIITNSGATEAYDVTFSDPLPQYYESISITGVSGTGGAALSDFEIVGSGTFPADPYILQTTVAANLDLNPGETIIVDLQGTLSNSIPPSSTLSNTGTVMWTSLNGNVVDRSTHNPGESDERTGTNPVVQPNDYTASSSVVIDISNPLLLTKSLIATSESHTTLNGGTGLEDVAIGEIVRYRLAVRIPEGTSRNLQFQDRLPAGMTFLDDGTARLSFVSDAAVLGSVSSAASGGIPAIVCANDDGSSAAAASMTCTFADDNISNSLAGFDDTFTSGRNVYFKFGDVTNSENDLNDEFIVVEFNAIVDNAIITGLPSSQNDNGDTLINDFVAHENGSPSPVGVNSDDINVTVREPVINNVDKVLTAPIPTSFDAGDTVSFTVAFSNTGSVDAFDVVLRDTLHPALDLTSVSAPTYTSCSIVPTGTNNSDTGAGNLVQYTFDRVASNCQISLTYTANILYSVTPAQVLTNTGVVTYTSLPGTNGTTSNPTGSSVPGASGTETGERNGTYPTITEPNDYMHSDNAQLTIDNVVPTKSIIATSETHTSDATADTIVDPRPVAIGEIMRYRLVVQVPEGSNTDLTLTDQLSTGVTSIFDTTTEISTLNFGAGNFGSLDFGAALEAANGVTVDLYNAGGAPQFTAPFNLVTLNGSNLLTFNLGDIVNNDNDANAEYIIIDFNVLVDNEGGIDNGDVFANNFGVSVNSRPVVTSNTVYARVNEPAITNLDKTVTSAGPYDAGDTVSYSVTYTNSGTSDAFEVQVLDALNSTYFTINTGSVSVTSVCATLPATVVTSSNTVDVTVSRVPVGCVVTITYSAVLTTSVNPSTNYLNTANITYTSLPGTGTTGNPTGSNTPGGSGAANGERNGVGGVNDQNDTDTAQITIAAIQPEKRIIATSETHTIDPANPTNILVDDILTNPRPVVVGEVMRYQLAMTVPEGTSTDFVISDQLSTGVTPIFDATTEIRTLNFGVPFTSVDFGAPLAAASTGTVDLYNAGGTPQFTAPFNLVTLNGSNLLTFNLGDIVNNDLNDGNAEYIIVEFNVLVDNEAGNQNLTVFDNDFTVSINGATSGTSNTVYHRVVEPVLATTKNDNDPDGWAYGQTVTYTVQVAHVSGDPTPADNSAADAFDLVVTDTIPAGLTYVTNTMTAPAGWTLDQSAAPILIWRCTSPVCAMTLAGGAVNLTYQVVVNDVTVTPHIDGNTTVTNTAVTTWTSQPGAGTTGNSTGSNTPGVSGATDGERNGSGGVNDYTVTVNHTDGLAPYYALGNRVWFDTDNSADINGAEVGVGGVQVRLYESDGVTPVYEPNSVIPRVTTTNATGYYLFDYLEPRDYIVVIPAANFDNTGVGDTTTALVGYWSSQTSRDAAGAIIETAAPGPNNDTDSDDNGTRQASGDVVSLPITIGPGEPTGEVAPGGQGAQPDDRANMTVDFGFYKVAIGNLVYEDINANGTYDNGIDTPLNNVPVELLSSTGVLIESTSTNGSGLYSFVNHPDGDYIVRVTTPTGMVSTIDTFAATDNANPDNEPTGEVDDNDNGIGIGADTLINVSSGVLTMDSGESGSTPAVITVDDNTGTTTDTGLDFGFVYPYALGNRVWFDTDNSADINGVEVGVDGVLVTLYHADALGVATTPVTVGGLPVSDTTTNGGYYLFDYLNPGNYVVVLPASNFAVGAVLEGYWSSQTFRNDTTGAITETPAPNPDLGVDGAVGGGDDDEDSDDNGTLQTGGTFNGAVIAQSATLGPSGNTEPTNDNDLETGVNHGDQPDGRSNLSVDFGFYKVSVGNLVWADADKDGVYDAGEPLFQNATVYLYAANPTTNAVIGAALASTTTDINGVYNFDTLPEGNYIVAVDAPVGTFSTIDSADTITPNTNTDDADNGIGETGGTVYSNAVFLEAGNAGINNVVDDGAGPLTIDFGATYNPTMDFGFTPVYSLGNRVWFDTNNNRIIDNFEVGVDDVAVLLYDISGNQILIGADGILGSADDGTTNPVLTDNGGYYLFNGLEAGDYVVVIAASNFVSGGELEGYWSSETRRDTTTGLVTEPLAHSPETSQDSDDNGTLQTSGAFNNAVIAQTVTLGPTFNEPQNEGSVAGALDATLPGNQQGQPDAQANMTVDFGFYTITLGDLVWIDTDNSGTVTGAEAGIDGVTVHLYPVNGIGAPVGSPVIATTAGGGLYSFTGLPQGNYIVHLPDTNFMGAAALRDYYSSTGAGNLYEVPAAPNPDIVTVDSDDNGTEVGTLGFTGGYIQSGIFALTPTFEGSYDNTIGTTNEPRVDFGVYRSPQVNLSIVKTETPDKGYYLQGETTTYSILVTNHGPADVINAVIDDAIPLDGSSNPMFTEWDWVCTTTGGATCNPQLNLTGDFIDTVDMPYGSTITYTVSVTVAGTATGTLVNTATVTAPASVTEGNLTDNSFSDTNNPASITITKTDGLTVVAPNSPLTYTITVTNNGAVDLTSLTVTDTLPGEVIFQSANPVPATAPAPNTPGGTLTWTGLSLLSGASTDISVTVLVIPTAIGPNLLNSVTVTDANTNATASATDSDVVAWDKTKVLAGTSEAFTPETITPPSTLRPVAIGEVLTYQISVEVPANSTLTNLRALDIMDAGLAFVRCVSIAPDANLTTDLTGGFAAACNAPFSLLVGPIPNPVISREPVGDPSTYNDGRRVDFNLGNVTNTDLANVQTLTITYEAIVLDIPSNVQGTPGLDNGVTWSWLGGSLSASANAVEIKEPKLSISKTADPLIAAIGSTITFTVSIAHTPDSALDAFDVVVTDDLPEGLTLIPGTISFTGLPADITDFDTATGVLTFTWHTFPLSASSVITFQTTFVGPAPVTNAANVAWTSLPIDPQPQPSGPPVLLSTFNDFATERWYDPTDLTGVNDYGVSASVVVNAPSGGKWLPKTGFAPDVITELPPMPADFAYAQTDVWIEIPKLDQKLTLVGVPFNNETGEWDLRWLGSEAGWLEYTAFPTYSGNSAITAHATLPTGEDGPFAQLDSLSYGDQIIVHINGQRYIYEVRAKLQVLPEAVRSVLKHEEISWLTLITCKSYNERTGEYKYRSVVRAVLLTVEDE